MTCCLGCAGVFASQDDSAAIGGLLPTITTAATVRAQKDRLNPSFVATHKAINDCGAISPEEKAAWNLFYSSWSTYYAAPEGFWGSGAEWDQGVLFGESLRRWQDTVAGRCNLPGPRVQTEADSTGEELSVFKWAAAAVIAVAVVYGVRAVFPVVTRKG